MLLFEVTYRSYFRPCYIFKTHWSPQKHKPLTFQVEPRILMTLWGNTQSQSWFRQRKYTRCPPCWRSPKWKVFSVGKENVEEAAVISERLWSWGVERSMWHFASKHFKSYPFSPTVFILSLFPSPLSSFLV